MHPTRYDIKSLTINPSHISGSAHRVAADLQSHGFDGYLVGGCVRDLLLGGQPKDFDIATNASPEKVRSIFRRSRIIGRRFKLVHVRFGREVIEVATYRTNPAKHDHDDSHLTARGRILRDNTYGTLEQDSIRRDFTINALYYDPVKQEVLDFQQGVRDIKQRRLSIIGQPENRFTEDPVRMLRALRFRAKLGLEINSGIISALKNCAHLLADVPPARLFDEILKMFHYGHGLDSWYELKQFSLLGYLFPFSIAPMASGKQPKVEMMIAKALENTDDRVMQGKPVIAAFLFAVFLWQPFCIERNRRIAEGVGKNTANHMAGDRLFNRQSAYLAVPRRVSVLTIEIWEMQYMLEYRQPKSIQQIKSSRRFRAAYDFLLLRQEIGEVSCDLTDWWTQIQEVDERAVDKMINLLPGQNKDHKKKRRYKRNNQGKAKGCTDRVGAQGSCTTSNDLPPQSGMQIKSVR